ncbi:MAG: PDZ domain-containing protein [Gemmatimonadota bacterium]|nr:PDZ domain-containing protein [Gemmatimonadota bacterium]
MILPWMLYSCTIPLLLALAASALESAVRQRGWPVRGLWTLALLGSLLLPILSTLLPTRRELPMQAAPSPVGEVNGTPAVPAPMEWVDWTVPLVSVPAPVREFNLDPWLLILWGITSAALLLSLAISYHTLLQRRRAWKFQQVDGRAIWISPDTGPAVVGFLPGQIVLPEWLLQERASERALALAHEEEHVRAGDPRLLLGALLVCVTLPWNLALWWMLRRLRGAVEIDCDLRVLARGVDSRAYSRLLVEVTERGTAHRLAVAALSESPSFLERRIRLMLTPKPCRWWTRAAGSVLLASGLVMAACRVDRPGQSPVPLTGVTYAVEEDGSLTKQPDTAAVAETEPIAAPVIAQATVAPSEQLDPMQAMMKAVVERFYPNLLTETIPGGRVNVYFIADARGEIIRTGIDTEKRLGNCGSILQARLGRLEDPKAVHVSGCGRLTPAKAGPNTVHLYWAALKPQPGEENAPPTGPFLVSRIALQSFPSQPALRAAVEQHAPEALRKGLPFGESLWFITDQSRQRVLHAGRGPVYATSLSAKIELEQKFPGIRIGPIAMVSVKTETNDHVPVVWATMKEPGSPRDPHDTLSASNPALQIRAFAVTSTAANEEVRIRLAGGAATDPRGFRIDRHFSREGNDLVARTPFMFVVVTTEPFQAAFTPESAGAEVHLASEAEGKKVRTSGRRVILRRNHSGSPIELRNALAREQFQFRGVSATAPAARRLGFTYGWGWPEGIGTSLGPEGSTYLPTYPTVKTLEPDSPAQQAGLRIGDVILSVNGRNGRDSSLFGDLRPNTNVVLRIWREEEEREISFVPPLAT